jgi:uncharacterized protein YcbK (DUF882 family)
MKMKQQDWLRLCYFSPRERWGDPLMMDRETVLLLDTLRGLSGFPFVIHCGYDRSGHTQHSQHYIGKAVDFHIEGLPFKDAVDLIIELTGPPPTGIGVHETLGLGIYPHWTTPGFHLDTRGTFARWGAVTQQGRQVYVSWDKAYEAIK